MTQLITRPRPLMTIFKWMLLIPGTGNGERGTENGEWGTGNRSLGTNVQRQPA